MLKFKTIKTLKHNTEILKAIKSYTYKVKKGTTKHLVSVSIEAETRLNILIEKYKKSDELLSEKNKNENQIKWIKLMNNYKNMVEKIILKELIYTENV